MADVVAQYNGDAQHEGSGDQCRCGVVVLQFFHFVDLGDLEKEGHTAPSNQQGRDQANQQERNQVHGAGNHRHPREGVLREESNSIHGRRNHRGQEIGRSQKDPGLKNGQRHV